MGEAHKSTPQNFAFVFPGQGSQFLGMLGALSDEFSVVKETFSEASDVLHYDLWDLVQQGPESRLHQTEVTQPALLAADIAIFRCWKSLTKVKPSIMAGHSLGEFAALVAAKALSFKEGIVLVAQRGRYMQEAVPIGLGAMAAIIGLDDAEVEALCLVAQQDQVVAPANFNAVGQVVIAGDKAAVERAVVLAKAQKAKIAKLIPVSVPSHSLLMKPAAEQLQHALAECVLRPPVIPVIHNANVSSEVCPQRMAALLTQQLVLPVRWVETIRYMHSNGINTFIECGPGKVLSGLVKRIERSAITFATDTPALLAEAIQAVC